MGSSTSELNSGSEDDKASLSENPEVLRARVEHTRAEVKKTITNIQERLSPERLKRDMREATVGKVEDMTQAARYNAERWSASVVDTMSQNPVPMALIGIGLMWLFKARSNESDPNRLPEYSKSYAYRNPYDPDVNRESSKLEDLQIKAGEKAQALRAKVGDVAETVQGKIGDAAQSIQHNTNELGERVKGQVDEFSTQVQQQAGALKYRVEDRTRRAKQGFEETFQENPWGIGAMAFAIGAAVGISAPRTQKEDEWMGETRDTLLDEARGKAQEIGDKVMAVSEKVQQTATSKAKEEAQKHGLR